MALEVPRAVKRAAAGWQDQLRDVPVKVNWVFPDHMHLTLVFLGSVAGDCLPVIEEAMREAARSVPPFPLEYAGLGLFGRPKHPRVIWMGLRDQPLLQHLYADMARYLRRADFELESRPYHPHLTLGRVKSPDPGGALTSALASANNTRFGSGDVDRITLFQSQLGPRGPVYSPHFEVTLKRS